MSSNHVNSQNMKLEVVVLPVSDVDRGVEVSEVFHDVGGVFHHAGTEGRVPSPIRNVATMPHLPRSAIQTVTVG